MYTLSELYDLTQREGFAETVIDVEYDQIEDERLASLWEQAQGLLKTIQLILDKAYENDTDFSHEDEE